MTDTKRKVRTSINRLSASELERWATDGTPFDAGNVWGREGSGDTGRLDREWDALYRAHAREGILYTVFSYATPIAWRTRKGWVLVGQSFSVSTSGHQSAVRSVRPLRNGADFWCEGRGTTVAVLPREQRPYGMKGNAGICPTCEKVTEAPNGVIGHHRTGPGVFR